MSTQQNDSGSNAGSAQGTASSHSGTTIGLGGATSGEEGATPGHETMAETGGSGGDALTQPRREETAPLAGGTYAAGDGGQRSHPPEGAGTAATAINRGFQDTRAEQAGPGATGLGAPETGGNQDENDLAPPRR